MSDERALDPDDEAAEEPPVVAEGQVSLFGSDDDFKVAYQEWQGMPEFVQNDLTPHSSVLVHFRNPEDRRAFHELLGQRPGMGPGQSLWYPAAEIGRFADKRYRRVDP